MSRSYQDLCGIARALDVVGERWALLVVRELMLGPKRFTDLQRGLPRVGPDMLAQRLRDLEASGILTRDTLRAPAASRVYQLTDRGRELEPVLEALGRFGSTEPIRDPSSTFGPDAAVFALPTLFDPDRAGDLTLTVLLTLGGDRFLASIEDGRLAVSRTHDTQDAGITIITDPRTLAALLWHGARVAEEIDAGTVELIGARRSATRFLGLFPLPSSR